MGGEGSQAPLPGATSLTLQDPLGPSSEPFFPGSNHSFVPVAFKHTLSTHYYSSVIPGLGRVRWIRTELCLVIATDSSQGRWCWEVQEGVSEEINDRAPASEGGAEVSWASGQGSREGKGRREGYVWVFP